MGLHRRDFVSLTLAALLPGCGWKPVYAPAADGSLSPAQKELAAITVGLIPNHEGVLLRQALQDRLEFTGLGVPRRYDLSVAYAIAIQGIAIEPDNSTTRDRLIASADWVLRAQNPGRTPLVAGTARALSGFNIINEQYFAAELNVETVQRRLSERVADEIALTLARYFENHPTQA